MRISPTFIALITFFSVANTLDFFLDLDRDGNDGKLCLILKNYSLISLAMAPMVQKIEIEILTPHPVGIFF